MNHLIPEPAVGVTALLTLRRATFGNPILQPAGRGIDGRPADTRCR
jgi:hypothetical protein